MNMRRLKILSALVCLTASLSACERSTPASAPAPVPPPRPVTGKPAAPQPAVEKPVVVEAVAVVDAGSPATAVDAGAVAEKPAEAKPADPGAAFVLGGDAAKGAETFKTMCSSCHGATGAGDGAAAAALNPKPANLADPARAAAVTDEYIYKMIKLGGAANGKSPLMVSWGPTLGDAKVRDVAAYVRSLAPAPSPAGKKK